MIFNHYNVPHSKWRNDIFKILDHIKPFKKYFILFIRKKVYFSSSDQTQISLSTLTEKIKEIFSCPYVESIVLKPAHLTTGQDLFKILFDLKSTPTMSEKFFNLC